MFGNGGEPKLIDFGSCEPFGEHLMSAGTPGWCQPERCQASTSDKANDDCSLGLLEPWLDTVIKEVEGSVSTAADWRLELKDIPPLEVQNDGVDGSEAQDAIKP